MKMLLIAAVSLLAACAPVASPPVQVKSTFALTSQMPIESDTVAMWRFDELDAGSPLVDATGISPSLPVRPWAWDYDCNQPVTGVVGGARQTGTSMSYLGGYAGYAPGAALQAALLSDFTFETMLRLDPSADPNIFPLLSAGALGGGAATTAGIFVWNDGEGNKVGLLSYTDWFLTGAEIPADGEWHSLAITLDNLGPSEWVCGGSPESPSYCYSQGNADVLTYIDGVLASSSPGAVWVPVGDDLSLSVGLDEYIGATFIGTLDEMRVSNTIHSAEKIAADYAAVLGE